MRNKGALQAFCIFFLMFIKCMVSSPLCSNDLYQNTDVETGKVYCCKEVLVKRGYEAIPCTENEAEDSMRECPDGQYQPDETNSSNSPECIVEPECTEDGIKNETCIDEYCWPVCICNFIAGKCGHYPSNCRDVRDIKCMGKILQDCSCALPDIPTQLPTSTSLKPNKTDWTTETSSPIPTGSTQITRETAVTKDGSDTEAKGNEVYEYRVYGIAVIVVIVVVLCIIIYVYKHRSNRPIEDDTQSIEMSESNRADKNIGDNVSEATDSGVCGFSKGSDENLEPGETDSNSITVSNGSDMEGGRNINNSFGDDHDAAQGHSSSQVEVHNDSKYRVEPTFAEEEESCLESDPFLSPSGCADDPQGTSQHSEQNCEPGKTNTNNLLTNELDDSDMTHCKWISGAGTNRHHTDADDRTDLDSAPSLCQLAVQKEPRQRKKTLTADGEDSYEEIASLQGKKVAVVSPFNEGQTVPVAHSPPRENSENQQLQDEGYPEGGDVVELDSMNWNTLGSSINHDSIN